MKTLYKLRNRSEVYLAGLKHLLVNPYKFSHLISDDFSRGKTLPPNLISRVKNPLNWLYNLQISRLSAEECQVSMNLPKGWTQSIAKMYYLTPFLYCAEECLNAYWQNAFIFDFSMRINKVDLNIERQDGYPVQCVFSMDIEDRNQVEWELKSRGQSYQAFNLNFYSRANEIGQVFIELSMSMVSALPPTK